MNMLKPCFVVSSFLLMFSLSFASVVFAAGTEATFTQNCTITSTAGKCDCDGQCDKSNGESKQCNDKAVSTPDGDPEAGTCGCKCANLW